MGASVLHVVASAAAAAGGGGSGEEHAVDWLFVASLFTNAIIFFGVLFYFAAPVASKKLKSRRASMAEDLEKAQKKQAEAEARLSEYQDRLDNLESEVARVVESYEKEARAERARVERDTDKALERLARDTDFTISQEMKKAERLIREKAVDATLEAAEAKIKKRITEDDQRRLTEQYVSSLERSQP